MYNKVLLIGNVGKDAEVRYTQGGTAVANFTMATTETFQTTEGTGKGERTEWHHIVVWARLAEVAGQYVRKGRQLFVEGRLQTRDWTDQQGIKHYKTEIVCNRFQLLGKKPEQTSNSGYDEYDIGDLGPPLDMDNNPLSPGD